MCRRSKSSAAYWATKSPDKPIPAFALGLAGRLSEMGAWLTHKEPDMTPEMARMLSLTLRCRSDKAERELGYRAVPLSTMFEDCYRWLAAEGLIGK